MSSILVIQPISLCHYSWQHSSCGCVSVVFQEATQDLLEVIVQQRNCVSCNTMYSCEFLITQKGGGGGDKVSWLAVGRTFLFCLIILPIIYLENQVPQLHIKYQPEQSLGTVQCRYWKFPSERKKSMFSDKNLRHMNNRPLSLKLSEPQTRPIQMISVVRRRCYLVHFNFHSF